MKRYVLLILVVIALAACAGAAPALSPLAPQKAHVMEIRAQSPPAATATDESSPSRPLALDDLLDVFDFLAFQTFFGDEDQLT